MRRYKNLVIIGTSHIAIESVREVERVVQSEKPQIVAIELDRIRFAALISPKKRKLSWKDIRQIGFKGFIFNVVGAWVEKKLGEMVGTPPGSDMLKAIQTAKEVKADIALIDQDIRITLKRLTKSITWKEKFQFLYDILKGLILRKPVVKFDLRKVPSEKVIKKLLGKVKKDYPSFYKTLIEERNLVMSKSLYNLMLLNKSIVAIVGAGHEEDIIQLIKKLEVKNE